MIPYFSAAGHLNYTRNATTCCISLIGNGSGAGWTQKKDKDLLKGILAEVTNIRFALHIPEKQSRSAVRNCKMLLRLNVNKFRKLESAVLKETIPKAKNQDAYQQRSLTQLKFKK